MELNAIIKPSATPISPGGESGVDFLRCLGGDEKSFIVLVDYNPLSGILTGMPLGEKPFRPTFMPTWSPEQLQMEIEAGVWTYVAPTDEEHRAEKQKRLTLMLEFIKNLPEDVK